LSCSAIPASYGSEILRGDVVYGQTVVSIPMEDAAFLQTIVPIPMADEVFVQTPVSIPMWPRRGSRLTACITRIRKNRFGERQLSDAGEG
jgi:hypothetical protein